MVWRAFVQIFVFYFRLRQQQLMFRRQRQIVRDMQVFEDLLTDTSEDWRGDLAPLVQTYG